MAKFGVTTTVGLSYDEVTPWMQIAMPKEITTAVKNTTNQTIRQVRTVSIAAIRQRRKQSAKFVRDSHTIIFATPIRPGEATLRLKHKPLTLRSYNAKVVGRRGRKRAGKSAPRSPVQVEVKPGQRKIVRRGFVNLKANGQIFRRPRGSSASNPIKKLYGPSLVTAQQNKLVIGQMKQKARVASKRIMQNNLKRAIQQANRRVRGRGRRVKG